MGLLSFVDETLASREAEGLGISVPTEIAEPINHSIPADGDTAKFQPKPRKKSATKISPALSMANTLKNSIQTRKIAFLVADGFDDAAVTNMTKALQAAGAMPKIIAPRGGTLSSAKGKELAVDFSLLTTSSVLFDAVYVPGGEASVAALQREADAVHFLNEAYKHCKAIAATGEGVTLLRASYAASELQEGSAAGSGVVVSTATNVRQVADDFIAAIAEHRHWSREQKGDVPA